jgi:signal transduction histidine kinase
MAPSGPPRAIRAFALVTIAALLLSIVAGDPPPGLAGEGLGVSAALAAFVAGLAVARPWAPMSDARRIAGLVLLGGASIALTGLQPQSGGFAGIYVVVVVAAARLPRTPALIVSGAALAGEIVVIALTYDEAGGKISGLIFSVVPWFAVMRLIRRLRESRDHAESLVEELRASRAEHAASVAEAERSRMARDLHDVLAHSLSALALQLESARLLARDRGADPDIVAAVERAHHLTAAGLTEAREAIGALRGDALPGAERLPSLVETFGDRATLTITGEPADLPSDAQLALYRTAQEALTNVRRHSDAERVDLRLDYEPDGVRLAVEDVGVPIPGSDGGGYGLTGMRERAELLGGRLSAGPTGAGFRVELWLPFPRASDLEPLRVSSRRSSPLRS